MEIRGLRESDYDQVIGEIDRWWGGRPMFTMVPRLFFRDFHDMSLAVEDEGRVIAFLVGYLSPADPTKAYIHFVGIDPDERRAGLGRELYLRFEEMAKNRGATRIEAVTSPVNTGSRAFHEAVGFLALEPGGELKPPTIAQDWVDFDGPGQSRIRFVKHITS